MRERLEAAKATAQAEEVLGRVYCPDWLEARVCPTGARGGYAFLLETDNFSVKVLGEGIPHRPSLYLELRSYFLHVHEGGPAGACREAIEWLCERLLGDQPQDEVEAAVSFETARLSRADLHCDWQGGWVPSLTLDAGVRFIKPGRVGWQVFSEGQTCTGYVFGKTAIQARIYNKSRQVKRQANDAYVQLLIERNPETYDPNEDVWRLEFELKREGAKGFRLYAEPETDDDDAAIDAELAAEDLPHIGTLPQFFAYQAHLWQYLTRYWLRLVRDNGDANVSRWPLDLTWDALHMGYAEVAGVDPLDDESRLLVRSMRFNGRNRILRRMTLGVVASLEVEDASPTSAALSALTQWVERAVEREAERAERRRQHYLETRGQVPRWVERGMGERLHRATQVQHRVQMLLGIYAARGVLPLELKPAQRVSELLAQFTEDLEEEAEDKGGVPELLRSRFAKTYKVAAPANLFAVPA